MSADRGIEQELYSLMYKLGRPVTEEEYRELVDRVHDERVKRIVAEKMLEILEETKSNDCDCCG